MILAVDFDGVIHDRKNPIPGRRMGPPLSDAPEAMHFLYNSGHTLIIHTLMASTPGGQRAVEDWLQYYGIPHHGVTVVKPYADFYIDDKAIRHLNWANTFAEMRRLGRL